MFYSRVHQLIFTSCIAPPRNRGLALSWEKAKHMRTNSEGQKDRRKGSRRITQQEQWCKKKEENKQKGGCTASSSHLPPLSSISVLPTSISKYQLIINHLTRRKTWISSAAFFPDLEHVDHYKVDASVIFCQSNCKTVSIATTIVGFGCLMIMIMIIVIIIMIIMIMIIGMISTIGGLEEGRLLWSLWFPFSSLPSSSTVDGRGSNRFQWQWLWQWQWFWQYIWSIMSMIWQIPPLQRLVKA